MAYSGGYTNFQNDRAMAGNYQNNYPQAGGFQNQMAYGYGSGLEKLNTIPGVFIKQKIEALEMITGFETKNKYGVYACNERGEKQGEAFWRAKEKSDFCARMCLAGSCRPFDIKLTDSTTNNEILRLHRECTCTCLCLNRPELVVSNLEGGNKIIGKIVNPFNCCDLSLDVFDASNKLKFVIRGTCCQLGVLCKFPCEACQTVDFDILDSTGNIISKCQKRSAGFFKSCIGDSDYFNLLFPYNATLEDKALLLSSLFFLDFMYFEDKQNDSAL